MKALAEIEAEVRSLAGVIGAAEDNWPTFGRTEDFARPHIETDARGYHFVIVERGVEIQRDTTQNFDELLYLIFESVTFPLACVYANAHLAPGQDWRRPLFARQVDLLSRLSPLWGEREARKHAEILRKHPFRDLVASPVAGSAPRHIPVSSPPKPWPIDP